MSYASDLAMCLNGGGQMRIDAESETLIVANTLKSNSGRQQIEETYVACDTADSQTVGANQTTGFIGEVVASIGFQPNAGMELQGLNDLSPTVKIGSGVGIPSPPGVCTVEPGVYDGWTDKPHRSALAVRRLLPVECERLQGFPDGYTNVMFNGKPAKDGPRYKALGNSMAVPNIRWLINRIRKADAAHQDRIRMP